MWWSKCQNTLMCTRQYNIDWFQSEWDQVVSLETATGVCLCQVNQSLWSLLCTLSIFHVSDFHHICMLVDPYSESVSVRHCKIAILQLGRGVVYIISPNLLWPLLYIWIHLIWVGQVCVSVGSFRRAIFRIEKLVSHSFGYSRWHGPKMEILIADSKSPEKSGQDSI